MARREEEEIVVAWTALLQFLHQNPYGASAKELAVVADQTASQTRADLSGLRKKGLARSKKESGCAWWYPIDGRSLQLSFFDDPPDLDGLRRKILKARRKKGTDASKWWAAKQGIKDYEASVPGAQVDWSRAKEIMSGYRGSPQDLRIRLGAGGGATARWPCGCEVSVDWKGHEELRKCYRPVCERAVAMAKPQAKQSSRKDGEKIPHSKKPIQWAQCWMLFKAPANLKEGELYQLTCHCTACVSLVTDIPRYPNEQRGVIARDRGQIVCRRHCDEQIASGRQP